ncbi:hypothetical protein DFH09DRAFT_1081091 [Mycena vulgaris]|nr:hypothetical protein DFH09DRAFT_1081091 [Mycena vulgaris]
MVTRSLELCEIPREEVAGGAVGVVRGGFPREGAHPNRVIVSCQVRHSCVVKETTHASSSKITAPATSYYLRPLLVFHARILAVKQFKQLCPQQAIDCTTGPN